MEAVRKIFSAGHSLAFTIPQDWVRSYGLKAGQKAVFDPVKSTKNEILVKIRLKAES